MKKLVLRVATVGLSLSVLTALVVHASMTSGCAKTEPVKKEEPAVGSAAASTTAAATVAVEPSSPPAASPTVAKPAPNAPAAKTKPAAGGGNAEPSGYMPATKSGGVFHPRQQANPPPPQVQK